MRTKVKNPLFSKKLRAFLFFLILATIFWVLTRFSKQESGAVTANLAYTNVPKGKLLLDSNPQKIKFTLAANKFEILYYRIKQPTVSIDVASFYVDNRRKALVKQEDLKELLQGKINSNLLVQKVMPQELNIALESLNFKEVPVEIVSNLKYKSGFGASGAYIIEPKSVTITGAKQYIDTIDRIRTVLIEQSNIEKSLNFNVPLNNYNTEKIKITPKLIAFKQNVVEFSQKELTLPITIINAPTNATIRLLPGKINVSFNVPIENFSGITAEDFIVTVDYNKRNEVDNFVIPEITKKPAGIKDVELGTKKIDLLLFK